MNCKMLNTLLMTILVVLLVVVSASAQQLRNRVVPICTDVSDTATAQEAGFIPCDWYQTGTAVATPGYTRVVDQNTTLMLDVQRLSTLVTGLASTYGAAITASTLFLYDGPSGMFGPWYRQYPTSDTMTNSDLGGAPVLAANYGFNAATGRWGRFRLDSSFRLIGSIQDPLDANGNVMVGLYDAGGDGLTINATGEADVDLEMIGGTAINTNGGATDAGTQTIVLSTDGPSVTTTAPGYGRLQDGDSTALADVLSAHANGLTLTLNGLSVSAVMMMYNGATLDMVLSGATGGMQVETVNWPNSYDAGNAQQDMNKKNTASVVPAKTTTTVNALMDVLASRVIVHEPNYTVCVDNTGAAALTALNIEVSPDGVMWVALTTAPAAGYAGVRASGWSVTLAAGVMGCYSVSGNSDRYLRVQANCGTNTTIEAWYTANKN